MDGKLAAKARFFKVIMPGFHQNMNFPLVFCNMLKGVKSKQAIVRSCKGIWKMNVGKNSEGSMCFQEGWPDFVHHHNLSIGDFIVFEWIGDLHFNAFVFDASACEKEFLVDVKKELKTAPQGASTSNYHPRNTKREPVTEIGVSHNCKNPRTFILTMAPNHALKKGRPSIPVEFARSHAFNGKTILILRGPCRKTWSVKLSIPRSGKFRCRMNSGWHKFYVSNKLKDGDVCFFELDRHSSRSTTTALMDVQIFPVRL